MATDENDINKSVISHKRDRFYLTITNASLEQNICCDKKLITWDKYFFIRTEQSYYGNVKLTETTCFITICFQNFRKLILLYFTDDFGH